MISRKDRLAALTLGILVLVYAVISMPPGLPTTYLARIDFMQKKRISTYKSSTKQISQLMDNVSFPSSYKTQKNRFETDSYNDVRTHRDRSMHSTTRPWLRSWPRSSTDTGQKTKQAYQKPSHRTYKALSLNQSDSVLLEKLPGIGPVLASRIIRYRNKLGGFYHTSQLREVYGIDDSLFTFLEPLIEISQEENHLKKIDLNTATLESLRQHPYLRWEKAKAIIRYREANGPFVSVGELEKIIALDTATIRRLLPYVQVNGIATTERGNKSE